MSKQSVDNQRILQLARLREEKKAALDRARAALDAVDAEIVRLVQQHGAYPRGASRTRVLTAADGTELRVTIAQEIRVAGSMAVALRRMLAAAGLGRIFRRLFKRVDSYVLAPGAHAFLANLRASTTSTLRKFAGRVQRMFSLAIEERNGSPQVEVTHPIRRASSRAQSRDLSSRPEKKGKAA